MREPSFKKVFQGRDTMRVGDVGVKGKIIQKRRRVVVAVWWEVWDRIIYRKTLTEFFLHGTHPGMVSYNVIL